jgi:hypothetical protein
MVTVDEASVLASLSAREACRQVEAGRVHGPIATTTISFLLSLLSRFWFRL